METVNTNSNAITFESKHRNESDQYSEYEKALKEYFTSTASNAPALFTTDAKDLFNEYLNNIPSEARQHYNCNTCKNFVNRFGNIVMIDEHSAARSVLWNEEVAPDFFKSSVEALRKAVDKSNVNGVFLSDRKVLGQPVTGVWTHMSVELPLNMVYIERLKTANQMMAEKREDYQILVSALTEYSIEAIDQAVNLLKTESLYRSEKCLGIAEWFKDIHQRWHGTKDSTHKNNILWLAVGTAPVGFCHVKSSMIGTLLDDIMEGMSFDVVSKRFADKMHPLQYQRPQAAPSIGNIQQAEKIVEKLGIQKSLIRRFARIDEIEKIWVPKSKQDETGKDKGIFSHLIPKDKKGTGIMNTPPITMTWRKFLESVLPSVNSIEYMVPNGNENFSAILTASYYDAPPILQWDSEDKRNPCSHYVYHGGSAPSRWGLSPGYCKVTAICYQPSMWYGDFAYQGKSVYFILEGAKDSGYKNCGNAIFPECLKSELREIRSTIEAYSRRAEIEGYEDASACGIRLQYGSDWNATFRVTTDLGASTYRLDRWD